MSLYNKTEQNCEELSDIETTLSEELAKIATLRSEMDELNTDAFNFSKNLDNAIDRLNQIDRDWEWHDTSSIINDVIEILTKLNDEIY